MGRGRARLKTARVALGLRYRTDRDAGEDDGPGGPAMVPSGAPRQPLPPASAARRQDDQPMPVEVHELPSVVVPVDRSAP